MLKIWETLLKNSQSSTLRYFGFGTFHGTSQRQSNSQGPFLFDGENKNVEVPFKDGHHTPFHNSSPPALLMQAVPEEALLDRIVTQPLVVTVLDSSAGGNVDEQPQIGKCKIDLSHLIHGDTALEETRFHVPLTPTYDAMWDEPLPPAGAAGEGEAQAGATEGGAEAATPEAEPRERLMTEVEIRVTTGRLLGPPEDRKDWNVLSVKAVGAYALPATLSSYGVLNDDPETHPFAYTIRTLGTKVGEGTLVRSVVDSLNNEKKNVPQAGKGAKKSPAELEAEQAEFEAKVKEIDEELERIEASLNDESIGEEEKRKLAAGMDKESYQKLQPSLYGRAWVDLKPLLEKGVREVSGAFELKSYPEPEKPTPPAGGEGTDGQGGAPPAGEGEAPPQADTLTNQKSYILLSISFREALFPLEPRDPPPTPKELADTRPVEKLPPSKKAVEEFKGCVEEGISIIAQEFSKMEREDQLLAPYSPDVNLFVYLSEVLNDTLNAKIESVSERAKGKEADRREALNWKDKPAIAVNPKAENPHALEAEGGQGEETGEGGEEEAASGGGAAAGPSSSEGDLAALGKVSPTRESFDERSRRLAFEREMAGDFTRAARHFNDRLVTEPSKDDPDVWFQALLEAIRLAGGMDEAPTDFLQMFGLSYLQRERAEDALRVFSLVGKRKEEMKKPITFLCLALCHMALMDEYMTEKFLALANKPAEWFSQDTDVLPAEQDAEMKELLSEAARAEGAAAVPPPAAPAAAEDGALFAEPSEEQMPAFEGADVGHLSEDPSDAPWLELFDLILGFGIGSLVQSLVEEETLGKLITEKSAQSERVRLQVARARMLVRDFGGAAEILQGLLEGTGRIVTAHLLLGECFVKLGDTEAAVMSFKNATEFAAPLTDCAALFRLGSLLGEFGEWEEAKEAFLQSLRCRATAEGWYGLGLAALRMEDLELSLEALSESNLLDNEKAETWGALSLLSLKRGRRWEATQAFRQAMKGDLADPPLLLDIGEELLRLPHGEGAPLAEQALRKTIRMRDSARGRLLLGEALGWQEQQQRATLELQVSLGMADVGDEDLVERAYKKAREFSEFLQDPPLVEAVDYAYKLAKERAHGLVPVQQGMGEEEEVTPN
uniref:Uncharacterized protein n=1 Tax=Chromera velia CCMP2878 TaxID=1169474 RepID=A0A0G4FXB9_9ALVE|eukprot:Cvel_19248.t1-p1 / transcript=Cvel_19248.t1 / gene=Cvel_19248 / organism=Chromera_velia_CCMP2878 / gene_product=Tetratricopeptide repeat protein 18, putative / transcript_product=Tetratricopeptide repeat protein 18, putative / location=Cvel_scaffold1646:26049-40686(+) / protein_length=1119 / sequence_SO=supercontig / SO=protein_coding / is_pseudo=false